MPVNANFETVINDDRNFIFHYFGPKNSGKTPTLIKYLMSGEQLGFFHPIYTTFRHSQPNMVIEHFFPIMTQLLGYFEIVDPSSLLKILPYPNKTNLIRDIIDYVFKNDIDTLKNETVLFEAFENKIVSRLKTVDDKTILFALDNSQRVFGKHIQLSNNGWEKEVYIQWISFIKQFIELSDKHLKYKFILISSEPLHQINELADYQYGNIEHRMLNSSTVYEKNIHLKYALEEYNEYQKSWTALINNDRYVETLHDDLNNYFSYIKCGKESIANEDEEEMSAANEKKAANLFSNLCKIFANGYGWVIINKIIKSNKNEIKVNLLCNLFDFLLAQSFLTIIDKKKIDATETGVKDIESIKFAFHYFKWGKLLEAAINDPNINDQSINLDDAIDKYINNLTKLLCFPLEKYMYSDIGFRFQGYSYFDVFKDILKEIEGKLGNGILSIRLKVLQGNIYYYTFPEDYLRALEIYKDALIKWNYKLKPSKYCGEKCRLSKALILFEMVSALFHFTNKRTIRNMNEQDTRKLLDLLAVINSVHKTKKHLPARAQIVNNPLNEVFKTISDLIISLSGLQRNNEKQHSNCMQAQLINAISDNIENEYFARKFDGILDEKQYTIIKARYIVAKLKYIELRYLGSKKIVNNILSLFREINRIIYNNYSPNINDWLKNAFKPIRTPEEYLMFITDKSSFLFEDKKILDSFWEYLIQFHIIDITIKHTHILLSNEIRQNIQIDSDEVKDKITETFSLITDRIQNLISAQNVDSSESMTNPNHTQKTQKTWRQARLYDLLGDCYHLKYLIGTKYKIDDLPELLRSSISQYKNAAMSYIRIESYNFNEKAMSKITKSERELGDYL